MPVTPEETLTKLVEATAEARQTVRELHEARAALLDVVKAQRRAIAEQIESEVVRQVEELSVQARERMEAGAGTIIAKLAADWRFALGLA